MMGTPKRLALQNKLSFRQQLILCYFLLAGTQTCWSWTTLSHPTTTRLLSISSSIQRNGKNGVTRIIPSCTPSYNQNTRRRRLIETARFAASPPSSSSSSSSSPPEPTNSAPPSSPPPQPASLQVVPPPADVAAGVQNKLTLADSCLSFLKPLWSHLKTKRKRKNNRVGGRKAREGRQQWMNSAAFKSLTKWAFDVCDSNQSGTIQKEEMYAGILLVHLHLANYFGVAATHPLNRTQVDELFDHCDPDGNGYIALEGFEDIAIMSCINITSRIAIYYAMLLALAPFLTSRLIQVARYCKQCTIGCTSSSPYAALIHYLWATCEWLVERSVGVLIFAIAIPWTYNRIDERLDRARPKIIKSRKKKQWWELIHIGVLPPPTTSATVEEGQDADG
jgi:hypothetical protein